MGWGSGWGAARETRRRRSLGEDDAPLNSLSPPPDEGGISSHQRTGAEQPEGSTPTTERCPAGEGLERSNRRTLAGNEGLHHFVTPARAACGELRQIRSGSVPSWATSRPARAEGEPQISMAGTAGKPDNGVIVAHSRPVG